MISKNSLIVLGIWGACLLVSIRYRVSEVYFIVSSIIFIFCNLGTRQGGPSAYSVFNKDFKQLLGNLNASELEKQFTHRDSKTKPDYVEYTETVRAPSNPRLRNKPCPCGSGLKHKKCCLNAADEEFQSDSD